ncbi:trypsin 5G1-like [Ctenocephalides felis]|uniref:trypsin 5G1-like n=1 Tax=Ctenocephalides felis TaxID=7515 RepID=UPI000E6E39AE|nr:trypsin 5G1-like [Ctenocephalides felis]
MLCLVVVSVLLACSSLGASHPSTGISSRIVGGHDTTIENYPYQVSLLFGNTHSCGGSLISRNWVLTAAHCISKEKYNVRVGSTIKEQGGVVHKVKAQYSHTFNQSTADFDYALLELETPVELNDKVQIIKIADEGSELKPGARLVVTGWGLTDPAPPTNILQEVEVPFIPQEECEKAYPGRLTDRMFCAGSEDGKGICNNDSGGPIVFDGVQYGIVSWSEKCGHLGVPGVYAKISTARKWIKSVSGV